MRRLFGGDSLHLRVPLAVGCGIAVACVAVATSMRFAIGLTDENLPVFPSYYLAIVVVAVLGGAFAGGFAIVLSAIAAWWTFMPPRYVLLAWPSREDLLGLVFFLAMSFLTLWVIEIYRRLLRRLRQGEEQRLLLLNELRHRNKNMYAVVEAIVRQMLLGDAELASSINGRIRALVATDDRIIQSDAREADIKDVLLDELKPYGDERIKVEGARLSLPADLARTLALVFHEFATNSAKYGAFSISDGRVTVCWQAIDGQLNLKWEESGCPHVIVPENHGFGTGFVDRLLRASHGKVETAFRSDGIVLEISAQLPRR